MNIEINIPNKIWETLDSKNYDKVLSNSVRDASNFAENRLAENVNKMVYGDKIGNSYVFTGMLLRGRKSRQNGPLSFELESNPQLAGAKTNYAPFVNGGKKRKVGRPKKTDTNRTMRARPFFDQTVQETKKESQIILKKNLNKIING